MIMMNLKAEQNMTSLIQQMKILIVINKEWIVMVMELMLLH